MNKHIIANQAGIPSYVDLESLWAEYAPYNSMAEFDQGFADYLAGRRANSSLQNIAAQAYDRGFEAGMKAKRAARWIEQNVGAN